MGGDMGMNVYALTEDDKKRLAEFLGNNEWNQCNCACKTIGHFTNTRPFATFQDQGELCEKLVGHDMDGKFEQFAEETWLDRDRNPDWAMADSLVFWLMINPKRTIWLISEFLKQYEKEQQFTEALVCNLDNIALRRGCDGHWLEFRTSNGLHSVVNIENVFSDMTGIHANIRQWAIEQGEKRTGGG